MPLSVTSWFVEQAASQRPAVKRKFSLSVNSDYSSRVLRWPTINRSWNDLRPTSVVITLDNAEQTFNFLRDDKTNMRAAAALQIGFTHPSSGDELITAFKGTIEKMNYAGAQLSLTLTDKIKQLSERLVGTSDVPVVMSGTTILPSDIAWWLATSYGGFSNITSTSNPDIDYTSWLAWAALWSGDTVIMNARFEGKPVTEALRSVGRHTQSAIFIKEDELAFFRFTAINTQAVLIDPGQIYDSAVSVDDADMVNKQYVYGSYVPASDFWSIVTFDIKSASVNSFGLRESVEKDESVWYTNSGSALNLAQRMTQVARTPFDRAEITTPLIPLHQLIGETIQVVDPLLGLNAGWRIMRSGLNMNDGSMRFSIDASQISTPFLLDISLLDGGDLLL